MSVIRMVGFCVDDDQVRQRGTDVGSRSWWSADGRGRLRMAQSRLRVEQGRLRMAREVALEMHSSGREEGSCTVGSRGQIRIVERRGEVEGLKVGTRIRWRIRQRAYAQRYDVGEQLPDFLRLQREIGVHGDR